MTKPVSCTNEVLLLLRIKKALSRGHRVELHEQAEVSVSSEISIIHNFPLRLGNAFERESDLIQHLIIFFTFGCLVNVNLF